MKKLLLLLLFISTISFAQVTPSRSVRIANSTTAFGETIPRGTIITDATTGKVYSAFLGLASTKTIATCALNSDIIELTGIQNTTVQQTSANFNIDGNGVLGGNLTAVGAIKFNNLGGTGWRMVIASSDGTLGATTIPTIPTLASGVYTPTLYNLANLTTSSYSTAYYSRVGDIVHVMISGDLTPTASGNVDLNFTLPIASTNVTQTTVGVASINANYGYGTTINVAGYVYFESEGGTIVMHYKSPDANAAGYVIQFDYSIN